MAKVSGIFLFMVCCNLFANEYINYQPVIVRGTFDYPAESLVLDITYWGGCGRHYFTLDFVEMFAEGDVTNYSYKLFDETNDICELFVATTAIFPLSGMKELVNVQKGKTRFMIMGGDATVAIIKY